ncbi:MAG TPA: hypothetical protein VGG38_11435 [Acidimicrobiales bacterium]
MFQWPTAANVVCAARGSSVSNGQKYAVFPGHTSWPARLSTTIDIGPHGPTSSELCPAGTEAGLGPQSLDPLFVSVTSTCTSPGPANGVFGTAALRTVVAEGQFSNATWALTTVSPDAAAPAARTNTGATATSPSPRTAAIDPASQPAPQRACIFMTSTTLRPTDWFVALNLQPG